MMLHLHTLAIVLLGLVAWGERLVQKDVPAVYPRLEDIQFDKGKTNNILTKNLENPRLEERLAALEDDITDMRITNGRQDIFIAANEGDISANARDISSNGQHIAGNTEDILIFQDTRTPVGGILPWMGPTFGILPSGWQRCDGSLISVGPLTGSMTPDLNSSGRFLRGSNDNEIGIMEDDSLQQHDHHDPGHTHKDSGHAHTDGGHSHYLDGERGGNSDSNHHNAFIARNCDYHYEQKITSYLTSGGGYHYYCTDQVGLTDTAYSEIRSSEANIQTSSAHIGEAKNARVDSETIPVNMKVSFVMRIY